MLLFATFSSLLDAQTQAMSMASATGSPVADLLLQQGPMGLVAAGLLVAVRTLWSQNAALRKQIDDTNAAWRADSNGARDKMLDMADKVHTTTDKLATIADAMSGKKQP